MQNSANFINAAANRMTRDPLAGHGRVSSGFCAHFGLVHCRSRRRGRGDEKSVEIVDGARGGGGDARHQCSSSHFLMFAGSRSRARPVRFGHAGRIAVRGQTQMLGLEKLEALKTRTVQYGTESVGRTGIPPSKSVVFTVGVWCLSLIQERTRVPL